MGIYLRNYFIFGNLSFTSHQRLLLIQFYCSFFISHGTTVFLLVSFLLYQPYANIDKKHIQFFVIVISIEIGVVLLHTLYFFFLPYIYDTIFKMNYNYYALYYWIDAIINLFVFLPQLAFAILYLLWGLKLRTIIPRLKIEGFYAVFIIQIFRIVSIILNYIIPAFLEYDANYRLIEMVFAFFIPGIFNISYYIRIILTSISLKNNSMRTSGLKMPSCPSCGAMQKKRDPQFCYHCGKNLATIREITIE